MDPCTISVSINGVKVLRHAQVLGEHQGRTTHDMIMEGLTDGQSNVTLTFEEGDGVLFLWDFDILVQPGSE